LFARLLNWKGVVVSVRTGVDGFYVAHDDSSDRHLVLGPFVVEEDATVCVSAVAIRLQWLGFEIDYPLGVTSLHGQHDQELPDGWLNPHFARGLLDPHRQRAEVVQYWAAVGEDVGRWVAYAETAPSLLLGRGQFDLRGGELNPEVVQRAVAAQDPLLARGVTAWVTDLGPRGQYPDGRPRTTRIQSNRLDVGTIAVVPDSGGMRLSPVCYVTHERDADDLYKFVRFALEVAPEVVYRNREHEWLLVMKETLPVERDIVDTSEPVLPRELPNEPIVSAGASQRMPTGERGLERDAGQLTLFTP
jgi:hypothetical protein